MFKCNFKAYEGNEKFIFVSYSHADSEMVYPIIERINAEGYRVWYDDGIAPGSEWPENIADHLNRCETVIFFASPNSVASDNCKREVNFALSRKKNFFTISLVPTELSLGLELQISTQQNILLYEYNDKIKFYDTLFFASSIAECKRVSEEAVTPVETVKVGAVKEVSANAVQKKSKKGLLIGIIAVVIALSGLVVLVNLFTSKVKFDEYVQYNRNDTFAVFSDQTIDSSFIKKLDRMKKIETLAFENCDFTTDANLSKLTYLDKITTIAIVDCNLADYSFFGKLTSLEAIELSDISLGDIESFPAQKLTEVAFYDVKDVPINMFSSCSDLFSLVLKNCSLRNDSFGPLPSEISSLIIENCDLKDSGFLKDSDLTELNYLDLSNNKLTDVSFISGSYSTLYHLDLGGNPLDSSSLSIVQNCVCLTYLDLSEIPMEDLSIIGHMNGLKELNLANCGISTLSNGSLEIKEFKTLILSGNNITSLDPLKDAVDSENIPDTIDISHNPITSFEGLPGKVAYKSFWAYDIGTDEDQLDVFGFLSDSSFEGLAVNYCDGIEKIKVSENLVVVDCPTNKVGIVSQNECYSVTTNYSNKAMDDILKENNYGMTE